MSSLAELLANSGLVPRRDSSVERLADGARVVYLHAGHLHASPDPAQITTILGSCVAVCLWDPIVGIGGMNHYMLPDDIGLHTASPRYARYAVRTLIEQLSELGAQRARLQARVYGGASVLSSLRTAGKHLGQKNVEAGRALLAEAEIPIVHQDTGAHHGRKVVFATKTGTATIKRV